MEYQICPKKYSFGGYKTQKHTKECRRSLYDTKIKQHTEVTYLVCELVQNLSGEPMATAVLGIINDISKIRLPK